MSEPVPLSVNYLFTIGPFLSTTAPHDPVTNLNILNTDVKLHRGGSAVVNKDAGGLTHTANGFYVGTLNATDLSVVGPITLSCKMAGAFLATWKGQIKLEPIFDALDGATASAFDSNGAVNVGRWKNAFVVDPVTPGVPVIEDTAAISVIGSLDATVDAGFANIPSQIQTELNAKMTEPPVGAPPATASINEALALSYMIMTKGVETDINGTPYKIIRNTAGQIVARKLLTTAAGFTGEGAMIAP